MSEDEHMPVKRPEPLPEPDASDSLARSLATRWGLAGEAYARLALTGVHTGFFLQRARSKADGAPVWRPDLGGLGLALVERFGEAIVGRQPELEVKFERRPLRGPASEVPELTLAGRAAATENEQEPPERRGFRPFGSLDEFRRALQARESPAGPTPIQAGPAAAPVPPPGQARPAAPASSSIRRRALSPGERPLSSVEEVPAGPAGGVEPPVTAAAPRAEEVSAVAREARAEEPDDGGPGPAPPAAPREREPASPPPLGRGVPASRAVQRAPGSDYVEGDDRAQQEGPPVGGHVTEDLPSAPPGPEVAEGPAQRLPREPARPPSLPAVEAEPLEEVVPPAQGTGAEGAQARTSRQASEAAGSGAEPRAGVEVAPRAQVQSAPPSVQRDGAPAGSLQPTGDSRAWLSPASEKGEVAPVEGEHPPIVAGPGPSRETTLPLARLQRAPDREEAPPAEVPPAQTTPVPETGRMAGAYSPEGEATTTWPEAKPGEGETGVEPSPPTDPASEASLPLRRPGGAARPPENEPEHEPARRSLDAQMWPAESPASQPSPASASVQAQPPASAEVPKGGQASPAPAHGAGTAMEPPPSAETPGELPARRLEETLVLPQLRELARAARRGADDEHGFDSVEPYVPPGPLALPASALPAGGSEPAGGGGESAGSRLLASVSSVAPGTIQRSPVPSHTAVEQPPLPSPGLGAEAGNADLVQRAVTEPEEAAEGPDLNRLARDVLPLIKRMLAVERERRTGRWR